MTTTQKKRRSQVWRLDLIQNRKSIICRYNFTHNIKGVILINRSMHHEHFLSVSYEMLYFASMYIHDRFSISHFLFLSRPNMANLQIYYHLQLLSHDYHLVPMPRPLFRVPDSQPFPTIWLDSSRRNSPHSIINVQYVYQKSTTCRVKCYCWDLKLEKVWTYNTITILTF